MSPSTASPLMDAALESICAFLRGAGLDQAAAAVDAERGGKALAGCGGVAHDLAMQLRSLANSLDILGADLGNPSISKGDFDRCAKVEPASQRACLGELANQENCQGGDQDWVDDLLRKIAQSDLHNSIDSGLSARLGQVLAESTCPSSARVGDRAGVVSGPLEQTMPGGAAADVGAAPQPVVPPPPLPLPPSAHYSNRRSDNFDPEILEEYRDDNDPGYRIREVMEIEVLASLQARYSMALAPPPEDACGAAAAAVDALALGELAAPSGGGAADVVSADDAAADVKAADGGDDDDELFSASLAVVSADESGGSPTSPSSIKDFVLSAGSKVLSALGMADKGTSASKADAAALAQEEAADLIAEVAAAEAAAAEAEPGRVKAKAGGGHDAPELQAEAGAASTQLPSDVTDTLKSDPDSDPAAVTLAAQAAQVFQHGQGQQSAAVQAPAQSCAFAQPAAVAPVAPQVAMPYALAGRQKDRTRRGKPQCRYPDSGDPFYPVELDGVTYDSFSLRVVYERDRTGFEESKEFPIKVNSIVCARYQVLEYLGSAAFSRAVQCLDLHTNKMVCMKIIKNDKDFLDQSLDEIKLLKLINANCENIDDKYCLTLIDYFYHKEHLIIVTELLRDNLYEFSKFNRECGEEPYFTLGRLQRITRQCLIALDYIHGLWLIHADLKPENILVKSYSRCEVKVIDFGSSCFVDDQLTSYVQSRSYRAPEVMLGLPYDQKVDIWSLGCIIAELWTGYVLFQNDSVQSLLARIIGIIGPFPLHMMTAGRFVPQYFTQEGQLYREPDVSTGGPNAPVVPERRIHLLLPKQSSLRQRMRTDDEAFIDFLAQFLDVDPAHRPTAAQALQHPWLAPGRYSDGVQL